MVAYKEFAAVLGFIADGTKVHMPAIVTSPVRRRRPHPSRRHRIQRGGLGGGGKMSGLLVGGAKW